MTVFFKIGRRTAHSGKHDLSRVPKHIGIIMDGNGRWAKRRGLPRRAGHKAGAAPALVNGEICANAVLR